MEMQDNQWLYFYNAYNAGPEMEKSTNRKTIAIFFLLKEFTFFFLIMQKQF